MNISANTSSIQYQQNLFNQSSQKLANASTDPKVDLAKELPEQMVIQKSIEANVATIRADDEMLGSLLDMKA
jgi:flagellar hook protein FlgE